MISGGKLCCTLYSHSLDGNAHCTPGVFTLCATQWLMVIKSDYVSETHYLTMVSVIVMVLAMVFVLA